MTKIVGFTHLNRSIVIMQKPDCSYREEYIQIDACKCHNKRRKRSIHSKAIHLFVDRTFEIESNVLNTQFCRRQELVHLNIRVLELIHHLI